VRIIELEAVIAVFPFTNMDGEHEKRICGRLGRENHTMVGRIRWHLFLASGESR
jgi:hypothetical protein